MSTPTISTRVVTVDPERPDRLAMRAAGALVAAGGLVAFPTESFYGLGADALDPAAIARVFAVKGRPDDKPLLVLVDSIDMVAELAAAIPDGARVLMARHWPGALTLVLRAAARVAHNVACRIMSRPPAIHARQVLSRHQDTHATILCGDMSGLLQRGTNARIQLLPRLIVRSHDECAVRTSGVRGGDGAEAIVRLGHRMHAALGLEPSHGITNLALR